MIIGIDFDDTISSQPHRWVEVIKLFKSFNWTVIVVTFRKSNCDPKDLDFLKEHVDSIIFTGQVNKAGFCESCGYKVDIWIDDNPMSITHNYGLKHGYWVPGE